jgi:hypothetical protein
LYTITKECRWFTGKSSGSSPIVANMMIIIGLHDC